MHLIDGRTAAFAAAEGQRHVVEFFLKAGVKLSPADRWGNTPVDDAKKAKHNEIIEMLERSALN